MRERSRLMPPRTGVTWPSSEVPAPNGTTGHAVLVAEAEQAGRLLAALEEGDGVGHDAAAGSPRRGCAARAALRWR